MIKAKIGDRDTIFEFYVIPPHRSKSESLFSALISSSKALHTECQTNDLLMTSMVYEFSKNINSEVVLFEDHMTTNFNLPEVIFRRRKENDDVFGKKDEDAGEYVLEKNEKIVATGGFLLHYKLLQEVR